MDIATIGGLTATLLTIIISILIGGNAFSLYLDLPSVFIVVVGSYTSMMTASPMARAASGWLKILQIATRLQPINYEVIITQLVGFAETARKEGLLSLDDAVNDIEDLFLRSGMRLVVDGTDPGIVKSLMYSQMSKIEERHSIGSSFFGKWASIAPAFGMIGTLLGLIGMMANLDDISSVGPNLAVAMITTLYGSLMANMFLIPIQAKLEERNADEMLKLELMMEGTLSVQAGENPKILEQKLYSFLAPSLRPKNLGD